MSPARHPERPFPTGLEAVGLVRHRQEGEEAPAAGNDSYLEALPDRDGDRGPTVQVEAVLRHHATSPFDVAGRRSQLAVGDDYVPSRPVDVHPDGASGGHDAATFRVVSYPERQAPPQLFAQPGLTDVQQRCSSVAVGGKIERLIIRHDGMLSDHQYEWPITALATAERPKFVAPTTPTPRLDTLGEPKCESGASNSLMAELETQSASGLDDGHTATYESSF